MRRDLSKNSTVVGGTAVLSKSSTAIGETAVLEMDGALSNPDAVVSKAALSIEPNIPSLIGNILRSAMNIVVVGWLTNASRSTGGYVKFLDDHADLPVLLGNDGNPVALFEFIEAIDGAVDYESLREELPTLSYAQINGAISFLRKVAQFNTEGVDIDELEDQEAADDSDLIEELKKAIANQETSRVLDHSELNR